MKQKIEEYFAGIVKHLGIEGAVILVESPENPQHGDYTTNVAMTLAGHLKEPPRKIAEKIVDQINEDQKKSSLPWLTRVEIAGPGFINLFVSEAVLGSNLSTVLKEKDLYGGLRYTDVTYRESDESLPRKAVNEAGQPSTKKPSDKNEKPAGKRGKNFRVKPVYAGVGEKKSGVVSFGNPSTPLRIMVEFAHPNTHKAFHIGHLRNITTGESVIRLLESQGCKVIRANYQGDVGMHIAKALYALLNVSPYKEEVSKVTGVKNRVEFLGKAYAAGSKAFEDPSTEGKKAKEIIVDINALIYASAQKYAKEVGRNPGSTDYLALVKNHVYPLGTVYKLWKETRQWSLDYFETIYKRVYSRYDRLYFESECLSGIDRVKDAVGRGVLKESDGAIIFDGKPYGLDTRVFANSLGLPTYEGKELGLSPMESTEFGELTKLIHCVGPEQASFFKVTFKVEELLGIVKPGVQRHLVYGWVKLKKGKMSSRLGNVVLGEWLIDEVKKEIKNILNQSNSKDHELDQDSVSETIAIGAIKYAFLKVSTPSEIAFDLKESINTNGDSGPYLQYTYARCQSVLRKAKDTSVKASMRQSVTDADALTQGLTDASFNPEERIIARHILQFPDVVTEAAMNFAPTTICTYLFQLAQEFNLFYAKHSILGVVSTHQSVNASMNENNDDTMTHVRNDGANLRLELTAATAQVLRNGLYLLGIKTLEKM